ncbi:MAG TPA: hypothetical protein VKV25_08670, partial [Acidimicrobiales bacterium]|nr:hypothetical protein [Acidimicrobiales bacterium]
SFVRSGKEHVECHAGGPPKRWTLRQQLHHIKGLDPLDAGPGVTERHPAGLLKSPRAAVWDDLTTATVVKSSKTGTEPDRRPPVSPPARPAGPPRRPPHHARPAR